MGETMENNDNAVAATLPMDAAAIAKNPEAYGFTWTYRDLNKGRDQKTLLRANVPHFEVPDSLLDTFIATFPKAVFTAINGTSTVIKGQNVARPFIRANPKATNEEIAQHIVRSVLLNVVTRGGGTRTMYVGADGKSYATLAEAQAASGTKAVTAVSVVELAQQFIADAVDMGVPFNVAREKALAKWPDAFADDVDEEGNIEDDYETGDDVRAFSDDPEAHDDADWPLNPDEPVGDIVFDDDEPNEDALGADLDKTK